MVLTTATTSTGAACSRKGANKHMMYRISTRIGGVPAKLVLRVDLLHGDDNQYRTHVVAMEYSLDSGGAVCISLEELQKFAEAIQRSDEQAAMYMRAGGKYNA